MADLKTTFEAALDAFNNAQSSPTHDYSAVRPFLANFCVMQKVDDPDAIYGNQDKIIDYLNNTQIGRWPRLDYENPQAKKHTNKHGDNIGEITGTGTYTDDTSIPNPPKIPVNYTFRFWPDAAGGWLLASAVASPS